MALALHNSGAASGERYAVATSGLIIALIALALMALAAFAPAVLADGDTWSHVATGDWIMAHGVPRTDPFSHSMPGAPWTAHEWLSEFRLAAAYRTDGWGGVALLTAFSVGAAAVVMGVRLARDLSGTALAVTLALGVALWTPTLLARPHVLALPIAAIWTVGLLDARDRDQRPSLALAPLMTLWSNLHGGFLFGLALVVPFACEAVMAAKPHARLEAARGWTMFGLAALGAALVNPYGVEALLLPFRLMSVENLSRISEWGAADFSRLGPMEVALIALIGFSLTRPMRAPPIRVALVVSLAVLALAHVRHAQLLGLVAPMLLARPIREAIGAPLPTTCGRQRGWRCLRRSPARSSSRSCGSGLRSSGRTAPAHRSRRSPPSPRACATSRSSTTTGSAAT